MSCPDWRALVAARDAEPGIELPAWAESRHHLALCSRCRSAALAADPLLVFDRLSERAKSPAAPDEIATMQFAVASLIRAGRVGQTGPRADAPPARFRSVTRLAAALGVCTLLALSGAPRPLPSRLDELAAADGFVSGQALAGEGAWPEQSIVEALDRPGARIYELPQADMAVVMIVDASLDV